MVVRYILLSLFLLFSASLYTQDLSVYGKFTDENKGIEISICSDSLTHHPVFGESYRLLLVKETFKDSLLLKYYLDINTSPDFPYDIITESYKSHGIIIIEGVGGCYLYDINSNIISQKIYPDLTGCAISDNQGTYLTESKISEDGGIFSVKILECGWFDYKLESVSKISQIVR